MNKNAILKNGQILNVIKNLYANTKCYVKMNGKLSNVFESEIGLDKAIIYRLCSSRFIHQIWKVSLVQNTVV